MAGDLARREQAAVHDQAGSGVSAAATHRDLGRCVLRAARGPEQLGRRVPGQHSAAVEVVVGGAGAQFEGELVAGAHVGVREDPAELGAAQPPAGQHTGGQRP